MMKKFLALLIMMVCFTLQTSYGAMVTIIERDISYSFTKSPGSRVTLNTKAEDILGWEVKSGGIVLDGSNSFTMPNQDVEIEAVMAAQEEFLVTIESPFFTKVIKRTVGDSVVVEAITENDEYIFKRWKSTGVSLTSAQAISPVLTFAMPENVVNLVAEYDLKGYTLTVEPGGAIYSGIKDGIQTITAPSQAGYTVTYSYNDGVTADVRINVNKVFDRWLLTGSGIVNSTTEDTIIYTYGSGNAILTANYSVQSIELPNPIREGYTFSGWYTSPAGGTRVGDGGALYTPQIDTTLYAQWLIGSAVLTVEPGGSTYTQSYNTTKLVTAPSQSSYTITYNYNGNGMANSETIVEVSFNNWELTGGGSITNIATSPTTYTYGKNNGTLTANYKVGSTKLPEPTRVGHKFIGWYTDIVDGEKVGDAGESYKPTSSIILYAHWDRGNYTLKVDPGNLEEKGDYSTTKSITAPSQTGYTVMYNFNGSGESSKSVVADKIFSNWSLIGEGSISNATANPTTYTYGAGDAILTANYTNGSITLPSPVRDGFGFDGWYTAASGGTRVGNAGELYTPSSNITLYAQWVVGNYEVKITATPAEGGTVSGAGAKAYGATVTLSAQANSGYTFSGWNIENGDISLSSTTGETTSFTMPTTDVSINATFTVNYYNLTVQPGNETPLPSPPGTTISVTAPSQAGYTVTYNYNGNGASNTEATTTKTFSNWTLTGAGNISGSTNSSTTSYTYGVGDATITANYVDGSVILPTPTRNGYTFTGWYTAASGGTNVGSGGESYTPTSDITLYAHWGTVSYPVNVTNSPSAGGTVSGAGAKTYGTTVELVAIPNSGYAFSGWSVESGGISLSSSSSTITSFTMPANEVSIKATFVPNTYVLTVNPGGIPVSGEYGEKKVVTASDQVFTVTYNYNGSGVPNETVSVSRTFSSWSLSGSGSIDSTTAKSTLYTFGIGNGTLTASYGNGVEGLKTPTRTNYTFNGWYSEPSGGTLIGIGGVNYTVEDNIVLYAQWSSVGSSVAVDDESHTGDSGTTIPVNAPIDSYQVTYNYNGNGQNNTTVYVQKVFVKWILSGGGSIDNPNANPVNYTFGTEPGTLTPVYGSGTTTLLGASRDGYLFNGWYTAASGGTNVGGEGATYEVKSNIVLYAQWSNANYTVNVDITPMGSGNVTGTGTKTYGNSVELKATAQPGYAFDGWTVESGGVSLSDSTTTSFIMPPNDVNITAKFEAKNYTLTLMPTEETYSQSYKTEKIINVPEQTYKVTYVYGNGASNEEVTVSKSFINWTLTGGGDISSSTDRSIIYTFGTSNGVLTANYENGTVSLPDTSRSGYKFNGWFTSPSGGTKVGNAGVVYEVTNNVTLYAQWQPLTNEVSAECSPAVGGTVTGTGTKTYGDTVTLKASPSTGYKFVEWSVVSGGITLSNTKSATISFTMPANNVSLIATFEANSYTLTVYPGGTQYTQKYGTTLNVTTPAQSYTVTYNYNGNGTANTTATASRPFNNWTLTPGHGSISGNTYTFGAGNDTLNGNYGTGTVTLPNPTRDGYKLDGWYTAATGGSKVGAGGASYTVGSNITLYAQWVGLNYSINSSPVTYATTLADAVSKANSGQTITVLSNIEDNTQAVIPSSKSLTLNLSGKTITTTANLISVNGTLTITDTAGGAIQATSANNRLISVAENGTLLINAGTISSTGSSSYGIYGMTGSTITLGTNDGSVDTSIPSVFGKSYGILSSGTVNYYDGTVEGGTQSIHANVTTAAGMLLGETVSTNKKSEILDTHVATNLTKYYNVRENAGKDSYNAAITTITDLMGTKNGSVSGATLEGDKLSFDGNDWVNLGATNYTNPTLEAVFSTDVITTTAQHILSNAQSGGYILRINESGYISFGLYSSSEWRWAEGTTVLETGKKYHAVGTYDGTTIKVYLNGELAGSLGYSGTITTTTNSTVLAMGTNPNASAASSEYLNGDIYMARIYNGALTAAQVEQNYKAAMIAKHESEVHTGATLANGGTCTICGAKYISINQVVGYGSVKGYVGGKAVYYSAAMPSNGTLSLADLLSTETSSTELTTSAPIDLTGGMTIDTSNAVFHSISSMRAGESKYTEGATNVVTYADGVLTGKYGGLVKVNFSIGDYIYSPTVYVYNATFSQPNDWYIRYWDSNKVGWSDGTFTLRGQNSLKLILWQGTDSSDSMYAIVGVMGGNADEKISSSADSMYAGYIKGVYATLSNRYFYKNHIKFYTAL